jgi:hypothetical protein
MPEVRQRAEPMAKNAIFDVPDGIQKLKSGLENIVSFMSHT